MKDTNVASYLYTNWNRPTVRSLVSYLRKCKKTSKTIEEIAVDVECGKKSVVTALAILEEHKLIERINYYGNTRPLKDQYRIKWLGIPKKEGEV